MNKRNIKILVAYHKPDTIITNDVFVHIHVGRAISNYKEEMSHMIGDDTGDNISEKNPFYCELTALYWGWKNIHDVKYCGLNHYRRYFDLNITEENVEQLMGKHDMIVVKSDAMLSKRERAENLMRMTTMEDFYLFVDTLFTLHPDCKKAFIEYFYNSRKSYPYQMFIAQKELYDEYCNFMFPVLFEIEKRAMPHNYTRLKRTLGYLGEWFLGLFIYYKNLKVKAVPALILNGEPQKRSLTSSVILSVRRFFHSCNDLTYRIPTEIKIPDPVRVGLKNDGIELNTSK